MRIFVFACSGLLVIAAGFALLSSEYPPTIFFERILSQPLPQKIAWLAILVAAPMLIVSALWQGVKLAQQRKCAHRVIAPEGKKVKRLSRLFGPLTARHSKKPSTGTMQDDRGTHLGTSARSPPSRTWL